MAGGDTTKQDSPIFNKSDAHLAVSGSTKGDLAKAQVGNDTNVNLLSRGMMKLYLVWTVPFTATFMAGYGISAMTAINAMPTYKAYFNLDGLGVSTGSVFALWPAAACATFWLGPILADRFGRRGGMFICALLFLLGTALLASAQNVGMLLSGRILLGASTGMMQPSAPPYIAELSPPVNRGLLTGAFNTTWTIGNVVATIIAVFTQKLDSSWGWRIPLCIQLVFPVYMVLAMFTLPESPRWLFINGQPDRARAVLTKYHGNGEFTPLVIKEIEQIETSVRTVPSSRWDYKRLVSTRASRYRLLLAVMMGAFGQLSGSFLTQFLPSFYLQVGVTSVRSQLIMTLIASLVSLLFALLGTYHTDRLGRRPMLIIGTFLCALTLGCAMISSSQTGLSSTTDAAAHASTSNDAASKSSIAFLILFGAAFAWAITPLQATYPSEVLSNEMRSNGMGIMVLATNLSSVLGQLTTPIALKNIGWWTYLPWICWDLIETALWYFLAVETKGRTLEELDAIFECPHPVKASLRGPTIEEVNPSVDSSRPSNAVSTSATETTLALPEMSETLNAAALTKTI